MDLFYLLEVAEGVEAVPGPGQSDTDAVVRPQKAHGPLLVAADQGQNDDVILLPLVVIHGRHAHICNSDVILMKMQVNADLIPLTSLCAISAEYFALINSKRQVHSNYVYSTAPPPPPPQNNNNNKKQQQQQQMSIHQSVNH